MKLAVPIGALLVAVTVGAVAVAVWASVASAPWEGNEGSAKDNEGTASVLCEDALERRRAAEAALQAPVSVTGSGQAPLSAFRGRDPGDPFRDEITRLESKLPDIERDIQRFCQ